MDCEKCTWLLEAADNHTKQDVCTKIYDNKGSATKISVIKYCDCFQLAKGMSDVSAKRR